jgi:hypothetical protein
MPDPNFDGFVKSPSAALRCNFVVAAHLSVRLTPQFLRALHLELFTKPSFWRLFTRSSNIDGFVKSPSAPWRTRNWP